MNDDMVRLSAIGQILRRRWRQLAVVAAVGALLGAGASLLLGPGYETSSNVLLQGPRGEDEVLTEAQIAMSSVVLDRAAAALAWGVTGSELRDSVSVEVVDGNVLEITGTAESSERAQQLTDRVTEEYVTYSSQLVSSPTNGTSQLLEEQREALRQQVAKTNDRISKLHGSTQQGDLTVDSVEARTQLEALRSGLAAAVRRLDEAEAASSTANMLVMGPAPLPTNRAEPTVTQSSAGGAALSLLVGVFAHLAAARRDRRLRTDSEIAAALGSAVVGTVDVPAGSPGGKSGERAGFRTRMRRLVRADQPWYAPDPPVPDDDFSRNIRYRRMLARLRGAPERALRLLVVVSADDPTARRAVDQLAVVAGVDGGPASVVTDRADPMPASHQTAFHVVEVSPDSPAVEDHRGVSAALVVTTAGTRTPWELVGIAEACADAGLRIVGTVVTYRSRPHDARRTEPTPVDARPTRNGKAMAGSA